MSDKPKDFIGKQLKTDIGILKVKAAKCSMITDKDLNIQKVIDIKCECGTEFCATPEVLNKAIAKAAASV